MIDDDSTKRFRVLRRPRKRHRTIHAMPGSMN